jgi:cell division inhibitor SepF
MSFFDELKRMTQPYDDDEDDFLDPVMDDEPEERPAPKPRKAARPARAAAEEPEPETFQPARPAQRQASSSRAARQADKVVNLNNGGQLKVVIVKPLRFETVAEIADHLLDRRAVLMNLEDTDEATGRRLIDFLSGVAYAQDGKIRKSSRSTYIITPYNVDLMGEQLDEMEQSSFEL